MLEIDAFAWDDAKSAACEALRGFNFAHATRVFDDLRAVRADDRFDYEERRELAFGFVEGRAMIVVFTMRARYAASFRRASRMRRRFANG